MALANERPTPLNAASLTQYLQQKFIRAGLPRTQFFHTCAAPAASQLLAHGVAQRNSIIMEIFG
jgi:hypothetical protein